MPSASRPRARNGCPLCGQPASAEHRPFCSLRCRDRDMLNWLGDGYRVPGPPADPEAIVGGLDSDQEA